MNIENKLQELHTKIEELMTLCMDNEDYYTYSSLGDAKEVIEEVIERKGEFK